MKVFSEDDDNDDWKYNIVEHAMPYLGQEGRRLHFLESKHFSSKEKKQIKKNAARSLRVPLRSAHRFRVTDEMQEFCKSIAENLKESQFESVIENAAPPFECTVFENMPWNGECVLVQRMRWEPKDMWYQKSLFAFNRRMSGAFPNSDNFEIYNDSISFKAFESSWVKRERQEARIAKIALPNSRDHPVYHVQTFFIESLGGKEFLQVSPFGFYFCPSGFLWKSNDAIQAVFEEMEGVKNRMKYWDVNHVAMQRSCDVFSGKAKYFAWDEESGLSKEDDPAFPEWLPHERKVCMTTTPFLPLYLYRPVHEFNSDADAAKFLDKFNLREQYETSDDKKKYLLKEKYRDNWIQEAFEQWQVGKTALAILSLFSTLNFDWVVNDAEPSKMGKRSKLEPDVPWNSHREIQINLPKDKGVEIALKKFHKASPVGVRRHWVRAHNRVIRKNGVPVRVVRVGEHQRGDAKLGTVTHDYVLERDLKTRGKQ